MKSYSTEELEEWIDKIENVNKKVRDPSLISPL